MTSRSPKPIMVFPRDPNPYQDLLYAGLEPSGFTIVYVGELTPSHTLNMILLPFEILARRIRGSRCLHVHWIFGFAASILGRFAPVRRLSQWWFRLFLFTARRSGVDVVWTVHNVTPHDPVFADDEAARRMLVRACSLVVAHSDAALDEVGRRFGAPRAGIVLPLGPYAIGPATTPSVTRHRRHFVFVGKVTPYKGVDDLLAAFVVAGLPGVADLSVAGACDDPIFVAALRAAAVTAGATLRIEHLSDADLQHLLESADFVALPLRGVTTSSTVVLALTAGVPVILPADVALQPEPHGAVIRYDGTVSGLSDALVRATNMSDDGVAAMRAAAGRWAAAVPSWREIGDALGRAFDALADGHDPTAAARLPERTAVEAVTS